MSYLFEKLHPSQVHVELSTSYYRGTFILKLFSSKVKSKFTPKVLCFTVYWAPRSKFLVPIVAQDEFF